MILDQEPLKTSDLDRKITILRKLFQEKNQHQRASDPLPFLELLNPAELKSRIKIFLNETHSAILISVSHDDYRKITGGVQICIRREEQAARKEGFIYLHVSPLRDADGQNYAGPDTIVSVVINGSDLGCTRLSSLILAVRDLKQTDIQIIIHHLLGFNINQLSNLIQTTEENSCILWLHDFYTICPSYKLSRNDTGFCHAPAIESNACQLCAYKNERVQHSAQVQSFFVNHKVKIVAPSNHTLNFWISKSNLKPSSCHVISHQKLEILPRKNKVILSPTQSVRVAYLGYLIESKGWPIFQKLVSEFAKKSEYKFYVFCKNNPNFFNVNWINVTVTKENPDAMMNEIAKNEIDIAILWPNWPETFSLTAFEALGGSAFIVTNSSSGNIADIIRETGRGVVLDSERALVDLFSSGAIVQLAEKRRQDYFENEIAEKNSSLSLNIIHRK